MKNYELKDLVCKEVDANSAKAFISKYHYSKKCCNVVCAIGEWFEDELVNCIVFNYPCGREMAQEVWEGGNTSNTLELARMVSLEPKPKNLETFCISRALKYLKKYFPNIKVIISYADNEMGHYGYCYQASNFIYYGQSRPTRQWFVDGQRAHERTLNARYGSTSLEELKSILGDRLTFKTAQKTKSRYYIINAQNKKEKKEIEKKIKVKSLPYPKGDNERYDMFAKGNFSCLNEEEAKERDTRKCSIQLSLF